MEILNKIRRIHPNSKRASLSGELIQEFLAEDHHLQQAISKAEKNLERVQSEFPDISKLNEQDLIQLLGSNLLNFYSPDTVSPYVPLASSGPWIVTLHGGVIYDSGGYGMLGFGHNPGLVTQALSKNQTMANIMTGNFSQYRFTRQLNKSIRNNNCPYSHFCFMNTGSESVSVAARISDAHAKIQTDPGAKHEGQEIKFLVLKNSFHGRTYRAGLASNSTHEAYKALASFRNLNKLVIVEPNDTQALEKTFQEAANDNVYFEMMFMEPVMGEGKAGYAISPEFYALARKLTKEHNTLLLVDSIQAGMRCNGVLSVCDYPGFENLDAPDFETFSKAVNGGQFPLSVLAMSEYAAKHYASGIYGNTMTGNPRALDVGTAVLQALTPDVKKNIVEMGNYFKQELLKLQKEFPSIITEIMGQGLLLSAQLDQKYPVVGENGIEYQIRMQGFNAIHSSGNRLRFTPWFLISKKGVDLAVKVMKKVLKEL